MWGYDFNISAETGTDQRQNYELQIETVSIRTQTAYKRAVYTLQKSENALNALFT